LNNSNLPSKKDISKPFKTYNNKLEKIPFNNGRNRAQKKMPKKSNKSKNKILMVSKMKNRIKGLVK